MSEPRTLLSMAGVEARPHRLDEAAVVMIDAQNEYVDGRLALPGVDDALRHGAALLAAARECERPIVHVQHRGRPGGLFDPDGPAFRIAEVVAPREGEGRVEKALPNAFAGTDLDALLRQAGTKALVVAGFMTHMCVSSTVRAAVDLGYGCTVLAPACATRDLPDGRGGVVGAADLHRAELAGLADRFAILADDVGQLAG